MITEARRPAVQPFYPSISSAPNSPFFLLAFAANVAYTFLLFSRAVEFIDTTGKLHLAILTGGVCLLAVVATGGIPSMLFSAQGKWLTLFSFWIFAGLPFSSWKGGSVHDFGNTWIKTYATFFLIGGLIFTLAQVRTMMLVLALGACCQIYLAIHASVQSSDDRLAVTYGTLGNANDLASALLMGLPFIAFFMVEKKAGGSTSYILRGLMAVAFLLLLAVVLKTGSRGGLVSGLVLVTVAFFSSRSANKLKILAAGILAVALFAAVVPSELRGRYMTILNNTRNEATSENAASALESSNARSELLRHSLILTLKHPVFGVGMGQFAPQSADLWIAKGEVPLWFTSHDIYGLVSAEIGIPGLVIYLGLISSCSRTLWRLSRLPHRTPALASISGMAYCLIMSLLAFVVCGIFSTAAYTFQLPLLAAVTAALYRHAKPHIAAEEPLQPAPLVQLRASQPCPDYFPGGVLTYVRHCGICIRRLLTGPGLLHPSNDPTNDGRYSSPWTRRQRLLPGFVCCARSFAVKHRRSRCWPATDV